MASRLLAMPWAWSLLPLATTMRRSLPRFGNWPNDVGMRSRKRTGNQPTASVTNYWPKAGRSRTARTVSSSPARPPDISSRVHARDVPCFRPRGPNLFQSVLTLGPAWVNFSSHDENYLLAGLVSSSSCSCPRRRLAPVARAGQVGRFIRDWSAAKLAFGRTQASLGGRRRGRRFFQLGRHRGHDFYHGRQVRQELLVLPGWKRWGYPMVCRGGEVGRKLFRHPLHPDRGWEIRLCPWAIRGLGLRGRVNGPGALAQEPGW